MNKHYEISIWDDVLDADGQSFTEEKIIIIGSDTMTSESRAREPKLVTNINGTNKFTFNMYYSYIDTRTGEKVENPYIKYLINERKIKVFWKDKWYDLLVKQIKEDQVSHLFTYTCEDAYITELSRTGFELTFATELENNIGTAPELVEKVIKNTDWRYDADNSDVIYQLREEPVYETRTILDGVSTTEGVSVMPDVGDAPVSIFPEKPLLVFYSYAPDLDTLKSTIQVYYSEDGVFEQDENDMLVTNGQSFTFKNISWRIEDTTATAYWGQIPFFEINLGIGLSRQYRAERYVQSQKTVYNAIIDRYVNVYNNGDLLGYSSTEFNDALAVVNLFTNPSNFQNTAGWKGEEIIFRLYPGFDETTQIATYSATSFLRLRAGWTYNTGIQNNRPYIPNGFINGEKYVLRIKSKRNIDDYSYERDPNLIKPSVQSRNSDYEPTGTYYFNTGVGVENGDWLEYPMECVKSCPYETILSASAPFGLFLYLSSDHWIEEVQFFKEVYGEDSEGNEVRIDPGQMSIQSVAQEYWKYFAAEQEGTTEDTLEYEHISIGEWSAAIPVYNNFERYGTIEADNSNRFNILQSIAETFECWVRFEVEHDNRGQILIDDDGRPRKWVRLKRETGKETGIGFLYGVDLRGVTRNLKSDKISTKTIVEQNENEFGKNGFCSIARSEQNYPRENFIYNFDYYVQQGLLDKDVLYNDLYNLTGYYPQLHTLNVEYAKNLELLVNKKTALTKQTATETVYMQYISATEDELQSVNESIMKLAGADDMDTAMEYARTHAKDTKVLALVNDQQQLKKMLESYRALNDELQTSLEALKDYIDTKNARQDEIIEELSALNKWFFVKYARFIQEGTWTSEDYWNDDLYYLDAVQVAYESSRPQVSYDINVLRLSDLEDFSSKVFELGDISFIQDTDYFGYQDDGITPYKEKVVLTEITSFFETPDKDTIKVQNYKSQFDDLFQRITAAVQNLELTQGKYAKAANIVATDGTIRSSVIQNTFNENKDLVYGAQNESATIDNTGITVIDNTDASKQVKVTSGGVFVTDDAGATWKNAIRGDGISTDLLTAGRINTEQITIYNGDFPSFRWDPNGLNAYRFNNDGSVDTTQFVRFDQYGVYGLQNAPEVYTPTSESQIYHDANFGLTWTKFFMKSVNGDKSIEISTERDIVVTSDGIERIVIGRVDGPESDNYGIRVKNELNNTVFQCDNEGSYLSGWILEEDCLESSLSSGQSIRMYADGNIGCYASKEMTRPEWVYDATEVRNSTDAIGLNVDDKTFDNGDVIYPFVSSVGKTKTQQTINGKYDASYMTPGEDMQPTPPSTIQFVDVNNGNYEVSGLTWRATLNNASFVTKTFESDESVSYVTTYTYTWNLTAYNSDNAQFITLAYMDDFSIAKNRYVPASNTKWSIDNNGDAIFHEITADGGSIAGWWIDNEKIYQTVDGTRDGKIKTQLNSNGTATASDGFDYTIITDAINAAMATIGGVSLLGGRVDGYVIAAIAAQADAAMSVASTAESMAKTAQDTAAGAAKAVSTVAKVVDSLSDDYSKHKHGFNGYILTDSQEGGTCSGTTGVPS